MKIFQSIPELIPKNILLDAINSPKDLRKLELNDLPQLADELREFLLYTVGQTGGHFGGGLGVVELTIALHYVFETPSDRLVWDVGHQTYPHKILTNRKESMATIRQENGLHPFPSRSESTYDSFGAGHSSTSISSALGMITAARSKGEKRNVTAIIGDGAMTAGMAYEALSHAGSMDKNLLVVLNDNQMSISENVGGLRNYLAKIWASKFYNQIREGGKTVLRFIPSARRFVRKAEIHTKGMISPGTLFEELGFEYIGPINGHNTIELVKILRNLKRKDNPTLLHIITKKGKGYAPAESDPVGFHAINKIKPIKNKESIKKKEKSITYSDVFGEWLCHKADLDSRLMAITPAMREGSGMTNFSKLFKDRFFDVAIAEQHAITFAAGMACEGLKPVVAIYSTFLQRAYDQLIHDVALQNLDVLFAIDRAGLVGSDGSTHQGSFDISFLRCIPNMIIMAPSNEKIAWEMLNTGFDYEGPASVRYPRGNGPQVGFKKDNKVLEIGKSKLIKNSENSNLAILSFGSCLEVALEVGSQLDASVIDMNFVKPLDTIRIKEIANSHKLIVTLEENAVMGGAGSAVTEYLVKGNYKAAILNLGFPDEFINHGTKESQLIKAGLNKEAIVDLIKKKIES